MESRGLTNEPFVDAYCLDIDGLSTGLDTFERALPNQERQQALRFKFERDQRRFLARRGSLRAILSRYLDCAPQAIPITYCAGKPRVEQSTLQFSVSHSYGFALIAILDGYEVGCDIEWRDPTFAFAGVAERFFSPIEVARLRALPSDRRREGFYNCWTRKEAFVKARGTGLLQPIDSFTVSVDPGVPVRLDDTSTGWSIQAFEPVAGYHAAVVVGCPAFRLRFPAQRILTNGAGILWREFFHL